MQYEVFQSFLKQIRETRSDFIQCKYLLIKILTIDRNLQVLLKKISCLLTNSLYVTTQRESICM